MSKAYSQNYREIQWNHPYQPPQPKARVEADGPYLMPDLAPFLAPGMIEITSRSKLRAYEQSRGVRQCGELKTPQDYAPPEPRIDQRRIEEAAGFAIQRVLG